MQNSPTCLSQPVADQLLLVDGHCYAYRAFFGMAALTSPTGELTNAIYGFIRMLGKIQARVRPTHVMVVWDGGLADERMALLPEYKAQRQEMPENLASQLDPIQDYLKAARVASWMKDRCEADDYIATIAAQASAAKMPVVIASSDKDFMQLVSPSVKLLLPHDKTETLWEPSHVVQKTGVGPAQIVDWLSLVGDTVDNIAGVPGIGPKIAADLIGQFGSIEVIFERLQEVKSERIRASLQAAEAVVRRNQKLVRLKNDMPYEFPLEELATKDADVDELRRLYAGWGFKNMLSSLEETLISKRDLFHEHAHSS